MFWGRTHQFAFCIVPTISKCLAVDTLLLYTEFSTLIHRHSIEFQDFPKVHFFPLHKFEVINIFSCRQKIIYCRSEKNENTIILTNPIKNTTVSKQEKTCNNPPKNVNLFCHVHWDSSTRGAAQCHWKFISFCWVLAI